MKTKSEVTEESRHVVEALYAAAISGDIAAVFSLLDENIVCHESPSLPYGKAYRGHEGLRELFGPLPKYLAMEKIEIDHMVADGENVVVVIRLPVRSTGIETMVSEHHRVRNGKVIEQRIFFFEPTAVK